MVRRARAVLTEITRRDGESAAGDPGAPSGEAPEERDGTTPSSARAAASSTDTGAWPLWDGRSARTRRGGCQTPSLAMAAIMTASCSVVTPISWPMEIDACDRPDQSEVSRKMPGL